MNVNKTNSFDLMLTHPPPNLLFTQQKVLFFMSKKNYKIFQITMYIVKEVMSGKGK